MTEPKISLNGRALTYAQALTLRVAVAQFAILLRNPHALGRDKIGRKMRANYLGRIDEIALLMRLDQPGDPEDNDVPKEIEPDAR
jgi:hypothetical protein